MKKMMIFAFGSILSCGAIAGDCTGGMPGTWRPGVVLDDHMVCGSSATNSDTWQEFHASDTSLIEYAKGADPIDPTHPVGNWTKVTVGQWGETQTVAYNYTGSATTYTFDIYRNNVTPNANRAIVFCQSGSGTGLVATAIRQTSGALTACVPTP